MHKKIRIKPLIRIAAFDDGYFKPRTETQTYLVGVISRLDNRVEGLISTFVKVDGLDATKALIDCVKKSRFKSQVYFILLSGINVAGFNVFDIKKINHSLNVPVIVVFRKTPNMKEIENALRKLKDGKKRFELIKRAGKIHREGKANFQFIGCPESNAREIIRRTIKNSDLPEPIRLAHIIASGITLGESKR